MSRLTRSAFAGLLVSVLSALPAHAEPPDNPARTGRCVSKTASGSPGPPPDLAYGEPQPPHHFPFTCPPPPSSP